MPKKRSDANPSTNGANGDDRDERGRFVVGNSGGPGNPLGARISKLRTALVEAVSEDDMRAIVGALVAKAKKGDTIAARVLFDRVLGKPLESDILARVEALEEASEKGKA